MKKIFFFALFAAFLAVLFTGCEKAPETPQEYAESLGWHPAFVEYLGISSNEQVDALAPAVDCPNVSAEHDGVKLTVYQTLYDGRMLYTVFTIEADKDLLPKDGPVNPRFGSERLFDNVQPTIDPDPIIPYGNNNGKGTIQQLDAGVLLYIKNPSLRDIVPGKAILRAENFGYNRGDVGEFTRVLTGRWEVEWELKFEDVSEKLPMENVTIGKNTYERLDVTLSPVVVYILTENRMISGTAELAVQFADGSVRELESHSGGSSTGTTDDGSGVSHYKEEWQLYGTVHPPMDVGEVTAVLVDGVELPV